MPNPHFVTLKAGKYYLVDEPAGQFVCQPKTIDIRFRSHQAGTHIRFVERYAKMGPVWRNDGYNFEELNLFEEDSSWSVQEITAEKGAALIRLWHRQR